MTEARGNAAAQAECGAPGEAARAFLACPECHATPLEFNDEAFRCPSCGFRGARKGGVYLTMDDRSVSYFDALHGTMTAQKSKEGVNEVFYNKQFAYLGSLLRPGMAIVDIGCGPAIGYARPGGTLLIGVDPSYQSIIVNKDLDLRIFGSAQSLAIATASVDVVVCFYSIHHMIGASVAESRQNVRSAFKEFRRILKPGGRLVVFEVNPYWIFWLAEQYFWKAARHVLGEAVDFYFWTGPRLEELGRETLGAASLEQERYSAPWNIMFPPAFSIQWLRMPFLLYPFHVARFSWTLS